jgi:acetylornithine/LysW-gamma-L-lysine aminotransferase
LVREARGLGLFLGLELRIKSAPVVRRLQDAGILVLQAGPTVIRMLPPLVIEEADLEQVLTAVEAAVVEAGAGASAS